MEPLLFGLIGSMVDISFIDTSLIFNSLIVLLVALIFRGLGAYMSMLNTDLFHDERVFIACSWIPKATVQAALSSEIWERATAENNPL